jgi:hypothetical protein
MKASAKPVHGVADMSETVECYPVVLTCEGPRQRPLDVIEVENGYWRVDWIGGPATHYRRDPREHLRLGYDPRHLRREFLRS